MTPILVCRQLLGTTALKSLCEVPDLEPWAFASLVSLSVLLANLSYVKYLVRLPVVANHRPLLSWKLVCVPKPIQITSSN